jgi:hypothetical protein
MNRMEIVIPRASWSDAFSDDAENPLIPVVPCSTESRKGPATMHLPCPSFLSKEWGEVQRRPRPRKVLGIRYARPAILSS